jgi:UDP-N-acetyl-D-mannosaminuronate dehydrogenase
MATDVVVGLGQVGPPSAQDATRSGLHVLGSDAARAVVEGPGVHRL